MSEENAIPVIEDQPEAAAIEIPHEAGRDPSGSLRSGFTRTPEIRQTKMGVQRRCSRWTMRCRGESLSKKSGDFHEAIELRASRTRSLAAIIPGWTLLLSIASSNSAHEGGRFSSSSVAPVRLSI